MLRITTQMTGLAGAPYFSTLFTAGTEQAHADEAVEAVFDFWTGLLGFITAGLSIQILPEVDVLEVPTGAVVETRPVSSIAQVSTGNAPLPKATQGLLRARTSTFIGGRRLQGRVFIPALANDAQLGGLPSSSFVTGVTTAGEALRAALEAGDNDWVIWHRPTPGGSGTDGAIGAVTSVSTWSQFAVLRSRRD